ncbi:MAG: hypothetical protein DRP64_21040 [Verrucomicrobia bacterium]|nr:MAG: hypothetical protein DRP64_21040 [Verrucomicrobiota bacterium]
MSAYNKLRYSRRLADPRWQRKRLEIMSRDGFACLCCGSEDRTLHVHHKRYARNGGKPWSVPSEWLETLCEECHEARTKYDKKHGRGLTPTRDIVAMLRRQLGEPQDTQPRRSFRTFTNVRREHVEEVLFSHIVQDYTDAAINIFLDEGADLLRWSTEYARILAECLVAWREENKYRPLSVERYLNAGQYTHDGPYRLYLYGLLTRTIPDAGNTEQVVRDAMQRIRMANKMEDYALNDGTTP